VEHAATKTDDILALAHSRSPEQRERLLMAVADLCGGAGPLSNDARGMVHDIFMDLVAQAERDIRLRLAERIADAAWAPPALISILALDDIEIARPVIAKSPILRDADLIRLLVEATLEHQIEVARRPGIGAPVVSAILDQGQPAVLTALAGNATARVTPMQMERLVAAARRIAAMRGPLARHPGLTEPLANMLYSWVGEALRASIAERFTIDPALLSQTVSEAVADVVDGPEPPVERSSAQAEHEQVEMERRLIVKLQQAGQLRPGYLMRCLREGRATLFRQGLAALGAFDAADVDKAIAANRPDLLALALAAVGIDRSAFPAMLALVQGLHRGRPQSGAGMPAKITAAFAVAPEEAGAAFVAAVREL
jgi:uncharacterized protein (DUF2336 family)